MKGNRLTLYILVAMVLGVAVGYLINQFGQGKDVNYTSNKDFVGLDSFQLKAGGQL